MSGKKHYLHQLFDSASSFLIVQIRPAWRYCNLAILETSWISKFWNTDITFSELYLGSISFQNTPTVTQSVSFACNFSNSQKVYFLSKNSASLNTLKLCNSFWRKHNREISVTSALNSCRIRFAPCFCWRRLFGQFALSVIPNANNVINYSLHTTCRCNLQNAHLSDMVNLVETIRIFLNICKLKYIWFF